jgi:hypothetical protein
VRPGDTVIALAVAGFSPSPALERNSIQIG